MNNKPRILFYDIETTPLAAWIWGLGKQIIRPHQLLKAYSRFGIICITYCWNDNKAAQSIDWGYEEQNTEKVIKEFDEIIKQADWVIGKNSQKFDNKMVNAARALNRLPGMPDWIRYTDDLEKQVRKYFRLPSYGLDYLSDQFGYGGKMRMEFQDWIDIVEKTEDGPQAFKKMIKYGKKDVVDTRGLWFDLEEHFEPRFNKAAWSGSKMACKNCGSNNLRKNGPKDIVDEFGVSGVTKYQKYHCKNCHRYAGRIKYGTIGVLR